MGGVAVFCDGDMRLLTMMWEDRPYAKIMNNLRFDGKLDWEWEGGRSVMNDGFQPGANLGSLDELNISSLLAFVS